MGSLREIISYLSTWDRSSPESKREDENREGYGYTVVQTEIQTEKDNPNKCFSGSFNTSSNLRFDLFRYLVKVKTLSKKSILSPETIVYVCLCVWLGPRERLQCDYSVICVGAVCNGCCPFAKGFLKILCIPDISSIPPTSWLQ